MNIVKNEKGITLIALVITIIILLILAGLTLTFGYNLIIEKAVIANAKTTEAILKENIELAWIDAQADYLENARRDKNVNQVEYINSKFKENLQQINEFSKINVTDKGDGNIIVELEDKNQEYVFELGLDGAGKQEILLKGNVKVGDYIEYPLDYYDVYSGEYWTSQNGWMVIDDGVMQGTLGRVRITSTHIPAKWNYSTFKYTSNVLAENALINDFENLEFVHTTALEENEEVQVNKNIKGSYFKITPIAKKVTAMTVSDLNYAYNAFYSTNRAENDVSLFNDKDDLFHIRDPGIYHWLATRNKDSNNTIYSIGYSFTKECLEIKDDYDLRLGIKPVIELDENQVGILNANIWEMIY